MSEYKTDLEIAREANKLPISKVASERLSISEKNLIPFGHFKAKLNSSYLNELDQKDDVISLYITLSMLLC